MTIVAPTPVDEEAPAQTALELVDAGIRATTHRDLVPSVEVLNLLLDLRKLLTDN